MSAMVAKIGLVLMSMLITGGCTETVHASNTLSTENEPRLVYPAPVRLVAIGDIHGDIKAARAALVLAGAINEHDEWIGGELVVVQVGDQLDRGDDEQEILELFDRLRHDAMQAGGGFHALNGNHELMNCKLDLRYVTPGGFADFEDAVEVDPNDAELNEYPQEQRARVAAFRPSGPYATMLADQNTIVIVGDTLFVHGGVHVSHVEYGLDRINQEVRAWLLGDGDRPEVISGKASPVWCRHYSLDVVPESRAMLEEVLDVLGLERMVVAHTVQEDGITSHFDGQVWCVDVGMSAHYGGPIQVLEIIGDKVRVLAGD